MNNKLKKFTALVLSLIIALSISLTGFAGGDMFAEEAYANVVTFSDCQTYGPGAYNYFGKVLRVLSNDNMPEPDSLLCGGDYTRVLYDYATPGMIQLREQYTKVYPEGNPDDIICIQGNHDLKVNGFYPTGMYDMGTYHLYILNEDQFPWDQGGTSGSEAIVKKTAADIKSSLDRIIGSGDRRPVIILTHVPLHFTSRKSYGDNLYSSYIFSALNEAAQTLDIIFLFGHNHSGDYDDYIGGSVNFMAPGSSIRIPDYKNRGANGYTEETLNFTYTNCGYVGYAENHVTKTSTNELTVGVIRFFEDRFEIIKYSDKGFFRSDTVQRINAASDDEMQAETGCANLKRNNESGWETEKSIFEPLVRLFYTILGIFG